MSVSFEQLANRILRKLDDPSQSNFGEELVYDAVLSAHTAILPWVPKQSVVVLTSGSSGNDLELPADIYTVQSVQEVETGRFIPHASMAPKTIRNTESITRNDWIEYPKGYLNLAADLDEGVQLRLYYFAYWQVPANESDLTFVLEVPEAAVTAIVLYSASYCLKAKGSNTASIRQWAQRTIDAGNREDNPLRRHADRLYQDFLNEKKLMPPYAKALQQ